MKRFMKTMISLILVCCMLLSTVVAFGVELDSNSAATNPSGGTANVATGSTTKSKTATQLYDDKYTDVTLSVPGEVETLSTDIVFVVDKSSSDKLSATFANSLFEQLLAVHKVSGAIIKVGVVIYNYDGHVALPLTVLAEDNYDTLLTSLPSFKGGTNADAGLILAKNMLDADTEVDASRKHVILIGDGLNWAFDVNGAPHTILMKANDEATETQYGSGTQTWIEGRDSDEYEIPNGYGSWNEYWNQIVQWVEADGDKYVFDITNYKGEDTSIPMPNYNSEEAVASAVPRTESAEHALNMDRAIYDTWESYTALQAAGYSCNSYYTGSSTSNIGYNLMKMLAGSSSMDFEDIKYNILYSVSKGSKVIDYIGYSDDAEEGYDFDFVDSIDGMAKLPVLKVGGKAYITTKLDMPVSGATASYTFASAENAEPTFQMDYYYGNGTTEEHFIWTINENISRFAPVSLTYTLDLVDRSEIPGSYDQVYTNQSATLYPKDSDGNDGAPELFEKPYVNYVVHGIDVVGTKIWNDDNNRDGVRPKSITINLLADGEEVAEQVVTEGEDGSWSYSFTGLQKTKDGVDIVYTITEDAVEGYTTSVEGNTTSGEGYTVTNTHNPATTEITVKKVWDDEDDKDGIRPDSITVTLYANGDEYDTAEITAEDGWKTTFTGLYVYENGQEIVYTVDEVAVEGYTTEIDGYTITNTHVPEIIEITNPASVTLRGVKYLDLNPDSGFLFTLTDGNGRMVDYAISGNQGQFVFDTITFTEAGTYRYRITEVDGGSDSINYDTSVYDVVVTVTENGENLVANVAVSRNGANYRGTIAFYNTTIGGTYIPEEEVPLYDGGNGGNSGGDDGLTEILDEEVPLTGDSFNVIYIPIMIGALAALGVTAYFLLKKKKAE